ncbi:hypothetical protein A1O3_03201 [Capronia epimyces CBS 606.96]|uniref:Dehydrogenase/reductase n=1 Tax=Capronia epimyces CBS 606.96 TaxID=1182542 RepID=W9YB93_9EURO|nr:uncharacterized protein A1O3_03201 [Capronia epimyces CBS 606.96]EXJ90132.1 hypothetical protein A1O3_03201 [Capronia epimyces CBS 606.96]
MPNIPRSILITGGTSGLGLCAATEIARLRPQHRIILASRKDPDRSAASINQTLGQDNVEFMPLDLGHLDNVRSFVKAWGEKNMPPISELLLNAGLQFPHGVTLTADGVEATFGINHVGHALLFYLLQPYLADEARIVITASGTHDPKQKTGLPDAKYTSGEELAHPSKATVNNLGRQRYATSKLCNVMWTYALHRRLTRLNNKKWTVVAMDPGLMPGTGLARDAGPLARFLWNSVLPRIIPLIRLLVSQNTHLPQESGASLAWIALDEKEHSTSGVYYEGRKQIKSSVESYDETKQEELWSWTAKFVAANDRELQAFQVAP